MSDRFLPTKHTKAERWGGPRESARMNAKLIHHQGTEDTKCSLRPLRPPVKSGSKFNPHTERSDINHLWLGSSFPLCALGQTPGDRQFTLVVANPIFALLGGCDRLVPRGFR